MNTYKPVDLKTNFKMIISSNYVKLYLLHKVHVMQKITFAEVHVKRSVILIDRLGPDVFPHLKVQVDRQIPVHFSLENCFCFCHDQIQSVGL